MATKKKKRKKSGRVFYPVYCCFVVVSIAAIGLVMRHLWGVMADYEASMPKYVAQEVEKMFTERNFAALYQYDRLSGSGAEGEAAYVNYLNVLTQGQEITCNEVFSTEEDEKRYQVKSGGKPLGYFTLCKSGAKSAGGNDLWTLKSAGTSVIQSRTYLLTAPETSSVYADDALLGADSVVESGIVRSTAYLPEGFEHEKWCTYSVERCFGVPRFRAVDEDGREQTLLPDENGRLTAQLNPSSDDAMRGEVEEYVCKVAKVFARFTSDDVSASTVLKYVKEDTKASRYIRGFDGGWFLGHRSVDFANMRTENYVRYDENTFSCDVRYDYIIQYKKTTETYPTAYTFFFTKQSDYWLLFDFTVISE